MPPEDTAPEPVAADTSPTAAPDATPEAAPEAPEPSKWESALAQQQAQNNGLQAELKKHMAKGKEAADALEALQAERDADLKLLQDDTMGFLDKHNRSYGDLTADLLNQDKEQLTDEQKQIAELIKFKTDTEERDKTAAEEQKSVEQKAQRTRDEDIVRKALAEDGVEEPNGRFAYLSALGQESGVLDLLDRFQSENGYEPSAEQQEELVLKAEEGARANTHTQVEGLLKADTSGTFRKYLTELLSTSDDDTQDGQANTRRKGRGNGAPTLTNRSRSNVGPPPVDAEGKPRRLSDPEKLARAVKRMEALRSGA